MFKPDKDKLDIDSVRPINNLVTLDKIIENYKKRNYFQKNVIGLPL